MMNEVPSLVRIGTRCYRQFAISGFAPPGHGYKSEKAHLLNEDDGESEDDENINIDVQDFENSNHKKLLYNHKELVSEIINFNPASGSYWLDFRLPASAYSQLCGGTSMDRSQMQRQLEQEFKVNIKGSPSAFMVEIKAHSHEPIIKVHQSILQTLAVTPKPDEYIVKSDKVLAVIPVDHNKAEILDEDALQNEEDQIEEYPKLEIKYDNKWKGFMTSVAKFPRECADFLLSDKGKLIKKLKLEMKGNVEYQLNRQENSLEIIGWTEDHVVQGYACFIRALKSDRAADSFISSRPSSQIKTNQLSSKAAEFHHKPASSPQINRPNPNTQRKFTHFLSINLENNPALIAAQKEINSAIPSLIPFMVILPNRFHITLAMLSLESTEGIIAALNEIQAELSMIAAGNPIELTFDKPGFFGKPTEANVLYLALNRNKELNRLNEVNYKLHNYLMMKGILTQIDLKKQSCEIKNGKLSKIYHMTLAKNKGSGKSFDVSPVIDTKKFNIKCQAAQIDLMSLNTNSTTGSYPIIHSIRIA